MSSKTKKNSEKSRVEQGRIAYDSKEHGTYQVMLKGPKPKDAYILLGTFREFDSAKLVYDFFPSIAYTTIKVTDCEGKTVRRCLKTFRRIRTDYPINSALDWCEQSDDLFETVVKGFIWKQPAAKAESLAIIKPVKPGQSIEVIQLTNREKFRAFIERAADAVKQPLRLINGGLQNA